MSSEHTEQCKVIEWATWNRNLHPALELLFAIPNGGKRHVITAKRLQREGVKAGVPDLCLPWPTKRHPGLYIEMKYGKNTVSGKQRWWLERLSSVGYCVSVCYSAEAAITEICDYLKVKPCQS